MVRSPLVPAAIAAWVCAVVLIAARSPSTALIAALGLAVLGTILLRRPAAALALYGCALVAIATAIRLHLMLAGPIDELAAARATRVLVVQVGADPHPAVADDGTRYMVVPARVLAISGEPALGYAVPVMIFARDPAWFDVDPAQQLTVAGRLREPSRADMVAAQLSARGPPLRPHEAPGWSRAVAQLRAGLVERASSLPGDAAGLLPGLAIGDTSRLDPGLELDFTTAGLTHLVAVSGANLAIVAGFVHAGMRRVGIGRTGRTVVVMVMVGCFVAVVHPSPSVLRAAAMAGLGLLAVLLGRRGSPVPGLAAAIVGLLVADPGLAVSVSFQLSAAATAGLVLLGPGLRRRLATHMPDALAELIAIPVSAYIACAPVIASFAGSASLIAIPANIVAAPLVAPATIVGLVTAILAPLLPWLADVVVWAALAPAWWIATVAWVGAALPGAAIGWPTGAPGAMAATAVLVAVAGMLRALARIASRGHTGAEDKAGDRAGKVEPCPDLPSSSAMKSSLSLRRSTPRSARPSPPGRS